MRFSRNWAVLAVSTVVIASSTMATAQGFLFKIQILDREAIAKLDDQKLTDTYIDVMIEIEAVQTFYNNAGLTPKDFEMYKNLLRFRTNLILEFEKREIEVPRIK